MPPTKSAASKKSSTSAKANIVFPAGRFRSRIKKQFKRVSPTAGIYMAAALEYLTAELLEGAANRTRDSKRKTIKPHDLQRYILDDGDLHKIFGEKMFAQGGIFFAPRDVPKKASVKQSVKQSANISQEY